MPVDRPNIEEGKVHRSNVRMKEFPVFSFEALKMTAKLLFGLAMIVGTILTFYFTAEAVQDRQIVSVETNLSNHIETSNETFKRIDSTLIEQRKVIAETRETLAEVNATQRAIKAENGRLANEIGRLAEEIKSGNP